MSNNKTLSAAELRELEGYEQPEAADVPDAAADSAPRIKIPWRRRDRRKKNPRLPIPAAAIKRLAFDTMSLAHADARVDCDKSLLEVLAEWPALEVAWERGQMLRNLRGCAGAIMTVSQAARKLGFEKGQDLRKLLDTDAEIRDLWEQTRLETIIAAKTALVDSAKEGNQAAIRSIDVFLRDEGETPNRDMRLEAVSIKQLGDLFGVSRQSLHEWYTKQGLPRNADGSFDLATTIAWYGVYVSKRAAPTKGAMSVSDTVALERRERIRLQNLQAKGELLERIPVVNRFRDILQSMKSELDRLIRDIGPLLANKPPLHIETILSKFRSEFLGKFKKVPDEFKLSEAAKGHLRAFYDELCPGNQEPVETIGWDKTLR